MAQTVGGAWPGQVSAQFGRWPVTERRFPMERQPVESAIVKSVGYDPESETLEVELKTGGVYQFDAVSAEYYNETLQSGEHSAEQLLWDLYGENAQHRVITLGVGTNGRQAVESSMLNSLGYDAESETLEAEFHQGAVWQYYGVPEFIYLQLVSGGSIGAFMRDFIIGQYSEIRVDGRRHR
jgi:hypothetical protein